MPPNATRLAEQNVKQLGDDELQNPQHAESAEQPTQEEVYVDHPEISESTQSDTPIQIENLNDDPESIIKENLPMYEEINETPTKSYNGITGASLTQIINGIYEASVKWHKNLFQVPSGQDGRNYVKLMASWINQFNTGTCFRGIALKVLVVLPNLMLQKPSAKAKLSTMPMYWTYG